MDLSRYEDLDVSSTAVQGIRYNPETKTLSVKFHSGDTWYDYGNVSEGLYESFVNAASKGRFVWDNLYRKHWLKGYKGRK